MAVGCFGFNVFSYFYFWTTAFAWFFSLVILWAIFRRKELRQNKIYLSALAGGFLLSLVPYFILLQNRSTDVDSALVVNFTHSPDLFRMSEIISYLTLALFLYAKSGNRINWREPKFLFLLAFTLVAPIVFNQQILTGRILQPFHYEFFCANYISVLSFSVLIFHLFRKQFSDRNFDRILMLAGLTAISIGYFDTLSGVNTVRGLNLRRDDLMPAAQRIKQISVEESKPFSSVVLSFDFSDDLWSDGIDIPLLTSQPVLWQLHMTMFPDVGKEENLERLYKFLYYQNFDEEKLKAVLYEKNLYLTYALFGVDKTSKLFTGELIPVKREQIEEAGERYKNFRLNFNYEDARTPAISFVLIRKNLKNDLSAIDRWYERDGGEEIGKYILYRVKLRNP